MKEREIYSDLRCIAPFFIRIDGRTFRNSLSRKGCKKPFDETFVISMVNAIEIFFRNSGLSPVLGYTFSDEINLFFNNTPFNGRVEKLNSVISSFLSSALTLTFKLEVPIAFDARIIPIEINQIDKYLIWRQNEAWRNCLHSHAFYTLIEGGWEKRDAASFMINKTAQDMHELLFKHGINISKVPAWQRKGVMVHKIKDLITDFNKCTQEPNKGMRTKIVQNWDIPIFTTIAGKSFIHNLIEDS